MGTIIVKPKLKEHKVKVAGKVFSPGKYHSPQLYLKNVFVIVKVYLSDGLLTVKQSCLHPFQL